MIMVMIICIHVHPAAAGTPGPAVARTLRIEHPERELGCPGKGVHFGALQAPAAARHSQAQQYVVCTSVMHMYRPRPAPKPIAGESRFVLI